MKVIRIKTIVKTTFRLGMVFCVLQLSSCKKDPDPKPIEDRYKFEDDVPPADNSVPTLAIEWDETATKVSHDVPYAEYPRVHKIAGDSLVLMYHCGDLENYWDNIAMRKSGDGGATWTAAKIIVADNDPNYYGFANPETLVLQNGSLLLAYTGRGKPDDNGHDNIHVRISTDNGVRFGAPIIAAIGRSWEPAMIQLPDGEIQLFYSSEAAWWPSADVQQEILEIKSINNGLTWSSPKHVAYTAGKRDGMAVPLILHDAKGVIFSIESVNNSHSPWIVWSSLEARWDYRNPGDGANGRRWLATTENFWGGGPYMVQLPTDEILLCFQDGLGRSISDWKKSGMVVMVGNSVGRNFTSASIPYPDLPLNEGAYYSSLFVKDANTVILVTTRNFSDDHSEIYWKEGHIVR